VIAGGIGAKGDTGFPGVRGATGSVRIGWFVNNNGTCFQDYYTAEC